MWHAIYGASEARGVLRTRRGGAVRRELRLHGAPSSGPGRENDSVAARILDRMGVSLGRIRSEIERQVTRGDGRLGQDMQLTPEQSVSSTSRTMKLVTQQ